MKRIDWVNVSKPVRSKKKFQVLVVYKNGTHNGYYFNKLEELPKNVQTSILNSEQIHKIEE